MFMLMEQEEAEDLIETDLVRQKRGFPGGSDGNDYACNAGDLVLIPGSGRFTGQGNDNPLQYSSLENPMDRRVLCSH